MTEEDRTQINRDELPFAAPCRELSSWAPIGWVRAGISDLIRAPQQSLAYGLSVAIMIGIVSLLAWLRGSQWFMFAMLGGFVFLAPLTCIGLYAISAQLERGQPPLFTRSTRAAFKRHFGNEMVFALVLMIIFLIWARAAVMVSVFFPTDGEISTMDLVSFFTFGTTIGAVFAAITFSASVFSLPMIMHRDVDSITAIVTSVNAVLRNKRAMFVWLAIIVMSLLVGVATAFIGLVVIIPVIGYAAWHGYLETIDAGAFPRHQVGITSVPRPNNGDQIVRSPDTEKHSVTSESIDSCRSNQ
jgi:uncharacterized membrane protein